ncbi:pimeloyl-ACP methyl ester carboxylesterase [Okibacterium sp. HSC-33S16]|uniref:alpha/beta fold hydrolase n=1 Tax=Okibacterium sp. HSC-33S16 TaxID=2910965 RepID=UPI00209F3A27|nr:alpha/beta hydrolase [Okibacterium sp. HSC-33S16]MCP2030942.1 pimeloyl-ACP methyl ester carboxylesterase [Okibacterium sp. HSC-33S16]
MTPKSPYSALLGRIPVTKHSVSIGGSRTTWWEYGTPSDQPTLVLVHGFRGDHHGLEPVVAHLPGFHMISPDLPGFGESEPLRLSHHDIDGYAGWLHRFVDALELDTPPVLLGHSFGSIIVSAALARTTLTTPQVVLVNPIAAPALAGPRGILTRLAVLYYKMGAILPERLGFGLLRNRIIVRIMSITMAKTRSTSLRRWIHSEHDRYFSAFSDRSVVLEAFTASVSSDVSEFATSIDARTLLIAADRDDITPVSAQHALVDLFPDATLEVLSDVGHLIHYELPAQAASLIKQFLVPGRQPGERPAGKAAAGESPADADSDEIAR